MDAEPALVGAGKQARSALLPVTVDWKKEEMAFMNAGDEDE